MTQNLTKSLLEKHTLCIVQGLKADKKIVAKVWKVARIVNVMFLRKFKRPISCFQIKVFFLSFIFLCFFCAHYFSFALFAIIKASKWQTTHINKFWNINKIIIITMKSWQKSRYNAILNFPKYLISSYLGVTLSSCNIKGNFRFT